MLLFLLCIFALYSALFSACSSGVCVWPRAYPEGENQTDKYDFRYPSNPRAQSVRERVCNTAVRVFRADKEREVPAKRTAAATPKRTTKGRTAFRSRSRSARGFVDDRLPRHEIIY